jgi:hypothetical protein
MGVFFRIAGPLQQRLTTMGGTTNREIAAALHNDPSASMDERQCARSVCEAHEDATRLQQSFTPAERHSADVLAPRGNTIYFAGDPTSIVEDIPTTIDAEDLPELHESTAAPKGVRYIASRIQKLMDWRHFFTLHRRTPARDQPKLLTHVGHGSITLLQSDIPLGHHTSAKIARTTIRRITRARSLGRHRLTTMQHCPQCGVQAREAESLQRHVVRCPNGGMRHLFPAGLVGVIKVILKEAGVPDATLVTTSNKDLRYRLSGGYLKLRGSLEAAY